MDILVFLEDYFYYWITIDLQQEIRLIFLTGHWFWSHPMQLNPSTSSMWNIETIKRINNGINNILPILFWNPLVGFINSFLNTNSLFIILSFELVIWRLEIQHVDRGTIIALMNSLKARYFTLIFRDVRCFICCDIVALACDTTCF